MLPALASVLFVWILQELHAFRNIEAADLMHQGSSAWLYYGFPNQNLGFIHALAQGAFGTFFNFDRTPALNGVLWTMPIELAGSFFVFSFLALLGSAQKRVLIYLLSALLLHFTGQIHGLDFLCGIALSDLFVYGEKTGNTRQIPLGISIVMIITGYIMGALAMRYAYEEPPFSIPGFSHFVLHIPTLGSLLIVGAASFSAPIQGALEHSAISFLGRLSFPLYLFHSAILGTLGCGFYVLLRQEALSHQTAAIFASLVVLATSILFAWGAYYAVELPAIRAGAKVARFFHLPRPSSLAPD